jgi:SAM-dependent methyltransferase
MIDLHAIASNLERGPDGLWHPRVRTRPAYPDAGNAFCFEVEDHSFWFHHRNQCILGALRRLPPAGPVFDIGGGNGFVARALMAAGYPVVVVEPGPEGARNAQSRGLDNVVCAALDDAGFASGSLPAAGLFDVLEHLDDDRAVLAGIGQLLAPGGRLYVTVPAYQWLWSDDDDLSEHRRRYTLPRLRRVAESAGLAVEYGTYMFGPLPPAIALLRVLPSRMGLRPKADAATIRQELRPSDGVAVRAMARLLALEAAWLARGHAVPFGGSCLLVARADRG